MCVMACPCGSVLVVGVETLRERLRCSRADVRRWLGLTETLTCQIGTHQCTRRPTEEWDVRGTRIESTGMRQGITHMGSVLSAWPAASAEQSGPKDGRRDADHRRFD